MSSAGHHDGVGVDFCGSEGGVAAGCGSRGIGHRRGSPVNCCSGSDALSGLLLPGGNQNAFVSPLLACATFASAGSPRKTAAPFCSLFTTSTSVATAGESIGPAGLGGGLVSGSDSGSVSPNPP